MASIYAPFAEALVQAGRPRATRITDEHIREAEDEWFEGQEDGRNGKQLSDNPYPAGSKEHRNWQDGWHSRGD